MNGLDSLLIGVGIVGLVLTGVAVFGKRSPSETAPIGAGSLGVLCVGLGGMTNLIWLMVVGAALVGGAIWIDWRSRPHPPEA